MNQIDSLLKQFRVKPKRLPQWTVLGLAFLVVGTIVSVSLALLYLTRSQDLRDQAAQITDTIQLKLEGQTRGDKLYLEVLLNSKTYDVAGLELVGTIEGVETNKISVKTDNTLNLEPVITELSAGSQNNASAFFISQFASLDPSKPANTRGSDTVVATFIVSNPPTTGIKISLSNETKAPIINEPRISLTLPSSRTFTYSSNQPASSPQADSDKKTCNQNCATDTECQSRYQCYKGQCRLRDYLEDSTCAGTPDRGLQRSCNQYCADSRECAAGFTCYYNQCRNPLNVTNSQCANPAPARISYSTGTGGSATGTGNKGSTVTPKPSPSPTPRVVATNVKIDPKASPKVASASATPTASPKTSPLATPKTSPKASPKASIIPVPAEAPSTTNRAATAVMLLLILVGIAGIGFALFKLLRR